MRLSPEKIVVSGTFQVQRYELRVHPEQVQVLWIGFVRSQYNTYGKQGGGVPKKEGIKGG